MESNYKLFVFICTTSLCIITQVSCVPTKFLLPSNLYESTISISPSPIESPSSSPPSSSQEQSILSLIDDIKNSNLNVPEKVKEVCKQTDYPEECANSVAPLLDGDFEPLAILDVETKAFDHALTVAIEDISNILSGTTNQDAISTCKQMYDNAKEEVSKAMELATTNDKYGVNINLSAARTFIETCKDEIPVDDNMKDDSPIVVLNKLLSDLASNSLALGNFAMGMDESTGE